MGSSILYISTGLQTLLIIMPKVYQCKDMLNVFSSLHWFECSHGISAVYL